MPSSRWPSFSRQQEIDADQVGIRVIAKAGYDPFAASRFLVSLGRATDLRQSLHPGAPSKPDMMATHPSTPERVARAVAVARGIAAPGIGETGHDRYLAAIDGILYGDDPAQGFVRGRRFIHPKLGFAFTAPEDFVLENSAQAVLGVTQDGSQALRLDSMKVSPETGLAAYLASGWIEGLQTQGTPEPIKVNGLSGITVMAKAESWSFRLAAIRVGGDVYRLTFAAKDPEPRGGPALPGRHRHVPPRDSRGRAGREAHAHRHHHGCGGGDRRSLRGPHGGAGPSAGNLRSPERPRRPGARSGPALQGRGGIGPGSP